MTNNTIDNIEFPGNDLKAIEKFYGTVFGWTFTWYGEDYLEFHDGKIVGGFTKGYTGTAGKPLVILYHENLEQKQNDIVKNGGKITREIFAFPGGRRFHFTDPEGNELGVWSDK